jgi:hypothetical protein
MSKNQENDMQDEPKDNIKSNTKKINNPSFSDMADFVTAMQDAALAFKIFIIAGSFLLLMVAASFVLYFAGKPELRILENCIVFAQGVITTIIGFLFGAKIYKKKK